MPKAAPPAGCAAASLSTANVKSKVSSSAMLKEVRATALTILLMVTVVCVEAAVVPATEGEVVELGMGNGSDVNLRGCAMCAANLMAHSSGRDVSPDAYERPTKVGWNREGRGLVGGEHTGRTTVMTMTEMGAVKMTSEPTTVSASPACGGSAAVRSKYALRGEDSGVS